MLCNLGSFQFGVTEADVCSLPAHTTDNFRGLLAVTTYDRLAHFSLDLELRFYVVSDFNHSWSDQSVAASLQWSKNTAGFPSKGKGTGMKNRSPIVQVFGCRVQLNLTSVQRHNGRTPEFRRLRECSFLRFSFCSYRSWGVCGRLFLTGGCPRGRWDHAAFEQTSAVFWTNSDIAVKLPHLLWWRNWSMQAFSMIKKKEKRTFECFLRTFYYLSQEGLCVWMWMWDVFMFDCS